MSTGKKSRGMSSLESFFNEFTGKKDKESSGSPPTDESTMTSSSTSSSTSFGSMVRRSSWSKSKNSITSSLRTLVSPNEDAESDEGTVSQPGSRRRRSSGGANDVSPETEALAASSSSAASTSSSAAAAGG
ncbi:unnamed protein product, partial [Pylaiella littoralis]